MKFSKYSSIDLCSSSIIEISKTGSANSNVTNRRIPSLVDFSNDSRSPLKLVALYPAELTAAIRSSSEIFRGAIT